MATFTSQTKNTATIGTYKNPGTAWAYNEAGLTYDAAIFNTKVVYYESVGLSTSYSNGTKNTATITNQTKN